MFTAPGRTRRAITRIELLIVIGVILIVIGLLLPPLGRGRYYANSRMESMNNLKQMALALHNIASTHDGVLFPPSDGYIGTPKPGDPSGTIFTHMLPYIEQEPMYKAITKGLAVTQGSPPTIDGGAVTSLKVKTYIAPADPTFIHDASATASGTTSYGSNAQALGGNGQPVAAVTDGTSNTIALAERYARPSLSEGVRPAAHAPHYWINQLRGPGTQIPSADPKYPASPAFGPTFYTATGPPQSRPSVAESDEAHASGPSVGTVYVAMLDGSVRGVSAEVSLATWQAAHTPNSKDELGPDW